MGLFLFLMSVSGLYAGEFDLASVRSNYIAAMQAMQTGQDFIAESKLKWVLSVPGIRKEKGGRYFSKSSYYLGRIYFERQNWSAADDMFSQVISVGRNKTSVALYYLARTRLASNKYTDALTFFNQYRAKYGNDDGLESESIYLSAFAYVQTEDFSNAGRLLEELERRYPYSQANRISATLKQTVQTKLREKEEFKTVYGKLTNRVLIQSNLILQLSNDTLVLSNRLWKEQQRESLLELVLRMQNSLRKLSDLKAFQLERLNRLKNPEENYENR